MWTRVLQHLVDTRDRHGSHPTDQAQHHPALLALHTAGCAAVLNGREDILAALLTRVTWKHPAEEPRPTALALRTLDVLRDGRWLAAPSAGPLRNRSRHSSRLRADLREALGEACAHSDRAFTDAFDRLEYLMLLVARHLAGKGVTTAATFLARDDGGDPQEHLARVAARVEADISPEWRMLTAGAFGGDLNAAKLAAAALRTDVTRP